MNYKRLLLLSLIGFLAMFGYNLGERFFSFYLHGFLGINQISLIVISVYVSLAVSTLLAGILLDRMGSLRGIHLGALLYTPLMFFLAFLDPALPSSFWFFLVGGILVGMGAAIIWVGMRSFLLENFAPRGEASGILFGFTAVGTSMAGLLGGILSSGVLGPFISLNQLFFVGGLCLLLSFSLSFFLRGRETRSRSSWSLEWSTFWRKDLLAIGLLCLLGNMFAGMVIALVPVVIKALGGKSLEVGLTMFSFYALGAVTAVASGKISDVKGRKPVYYAILVIGAVSSLLVGSAEHVLIILVGAVIYGPFMRLVNMISTASVGDLIEKDIPVAISVVMFWSALGTASGALISSSASLLNLRLPFFILAGILLASTVLVHWLPSD